MATLLLLGNARAESEYDRLMTAGIELRRQGRDAEALEHFRRAYGIVPAPRALAQMALAAQALGAWLEAEKDLLAVIDADDPWIRAHRAALQQALEVIRGKLSTLTVESSLTGAEVWLDGEHRGRVPLADHRVLAGTSRLELRHPSVKAVARTIELPANAVVVQRFEVVAPEPPKRAVTTTATPQRAPEFRARDSSLPRDVAWVMLGAAGASFAGAVAAHVVRQNSAARYNDHERCVAPGTSRDAICGTYRGRAEAAEQFAVLGYVASAALGAGAAVLFLVKTTPPRSEKTASATWMSLDVHGLGVRCSGVF